MSTTETDSGTTDPGTSRPLDGVRVIDVGNFLAGPYAGTIMAEFSQRCGTAIAAARDSSSRSHSTMSDSRCSGISA